MSTLLCNVLKISGGGKCPKCLPWLRACRILLRTWCEVRSFSRHQGPELPGPPPCYATAYCVNKIR